jgi:hypothetical protein
MLMGWMLMKDVFFEMIIILLRFIHSLTFIPVLGTVCTACRKIGEPAIRKYYLCPKIICTFSNRCYS